MPDAGSARYETPVARITARAPISRPPSSVTVWQVAFGVMAPMLRVTTISAPSRNACSRARAARSSPETPLGKPR